MEMSDFQVGMWSSQTVLAQMERRGSIGFSEHGSGLSQAWEVILPAVMGQRIGFGIPSSGAQRRQENIQPHGLVPFELYQVLQSLLGTQ